MFIRFMLMNSLLDGNTGPGGAPPANPAAPPAAPPANPANPPVPPTKTWKDDLPDDLKSDPNLGPILDIPSLAKSFIHAQKMVGKDKIVIPDKFASDDDWQKVYHKLGLPESADKYEFKAPEGTDPEFSKKFKDFALKNGILPKQAEKLFEFYGDHVKSVMDSEDSKQKLAFDESVGALKKEYGQAYERKVQAASGLYKQFADEETIQLFRETGLGNNPKVIKLFSKIAEAFGEDKFISPGGDGKLAMTPDEAQSKINAILGNKDHPYWNAQHASHKEAVAEMSKLYAAKSEKA